MMLIFLFLIPLWMIAGTAAREINKDPNQIHFEESVIEFTDANFNTTISKYENILIMFYAPWCPHC
jgi:thioredoxin-like negative regulator of GroEL